MKQTVFVTTFHAHGSVNRQLERGFVQSLPLPQLSFDATLFDQALGTGACLGNAAFHQQQIQSLHGDDPELNWVIIPKPFKCEGL